MGWFSDAVNFISDPTGSANHAVDAQTAAANAASDTQRYMYDQTRKDNQPYLDAGKTALGQMQDPSFQKSFTMSDFQADPGYAFRMAEGQKALERSAAARGGLNSGAQMKAIANYGQDAASAEYNNAYNRFSTDQSNRFNRLSTIAGLGNASQGTVAGAGQNMANQVSSNQIGVGNAAASAAIGNANRLSSLIGQTGQAASQAGTMIAMSDRRTKKNIVPIDADEFAEMREKLKAYAFNYKNDEHGTGDWVGVMAQDLEKSKLGRTLVIEGADGLKRIDTNKVMSLFLATLAA